MKPPADKKTRWAVLALVLLAALSCAALWISQEKGTVAVITQDGQVLREIDLSRLKEPFTFTVAGKDGLWNTIVAEPGRIRVEQAACPDQICVRQGWISSRALPIVCLPNHLSIEIRGGEGPADAVTG